MCRVRLLHRILHRLLNHLQRLFEMAISDLEVMLPCHTLGVAHPRADHMGWESVFEFRLTTRPHVVEDSRPRFEARPPNDSMHLRSEILLLAAPPRDEASLPRLRSMKRLV